MELSCSEFPHCILETKVYGFPKYFCCSLHNSLYMLYSMVVYRPYVIFYKMKPPRMVMLCSTYLGTSVCPSNVFAHDNSFCGGITALYATVKTTDLDFGISVIHSCKILDMWQSKHNK